MDENDKTLYRYRGFSYEAILSLSYLVFASLWVWFSDQILGWLVHDPDLFVILSTCKGWFFLLCTAGLLYWVLRRIFSRIQQSQQKLQESEILYRLLIESASDGILLLDGAQFLMGNSRACSIYGASQEELIGATPMDFSPEFQPDGRSSAEKGAELISAALAGVPQRFEWQHCKPDGSLFDVKAELFPVQLGSKTMVQGVVHDLTELREAELEAIKAQQQLEYIVNNTEDVIYQIDLSGNLVYSNAAAEHLTGYSRDRLLTMNVMGLISEPYQKMISEQMELRIAGQEGESSLDFAIDHADGHQIWIELKPANVYSSTGELVGMQGVARDITQRVQAEVQLQLLSTAMDQAGEAVMITSADGLIQYVNPAFEAHTGYAAGDVLQKSPGVLKSGKYSADFYQKMWATIAAGNRWHGQLENKRKDGSFYTVDVVISPVRDVNGAIANYVSVMRDITDELELKEQFYQAQKMEAIGQLAGGVAHDFNNLLQVILGYGQIAIDACRDEAVSADIQEIINASLRAKTLVRQLLAFSRRHSLELVNVDLHEVVADLTKMMKRVLGDQVEFKIGGSASLKMIHADRGLVEQVLMNLCVNAHDAMVNGGTLLVKTEKAALDKTFCRENSWARPGRYIVLSVSDTGCGMDAETLQKIFEPFFTTKAIGKGTGLGLAAVFGIVQQHNGFVHVYSVPDEGTCFSIYFPEVDGTPVQEDAEPEPLDAAGFETILLADDDEYVRVVAETLLVQKGYQVLTAANGEEALALFERHAEKINMLLLDVVMPGISGDEVFERIHKMSPRAIPTLFASGYSAEACRERFGMEHDVKVIRKPYLRDALLRTVREVLNGSV